MVAMKGINMTKVMSARVDQYGRIVVYLAGLDRFSTGMSGAVYRQVPVDGESFYYSINGDVVHYLYHNPKNETGFGGHVYDLTMEDGSIHYIKGPWSSRNGVFHELVPNVDVVACITEGLVVCNVRKEVLERLGFNFKLDMSGREKSWKLA